MMEKIAMRRAALFRSSLLAGAALAGLAGSASALAQEADAQDAQAAAEEYGNEIVVTATKRERTLQDVPVAVSVTTAETIERAQIRDLRDLSSVVPSLRVNQLQSSANTNFYIRGFGNGANNAGIEPSVGLFIDGVYRSRSASMIADLPDVQRIEVLRGPQSTLFGKNASAGVISITTKEPQFTTGGNYEASYGNYDAIVLKGVVTGPLSETVAVSVAGGVNSRDGYVRDLGTGHRANERNRWFVRGQLLFKPSSDLKIRLIGDYGEIDENCCAAINLQRSAYSLALLAPNVGGQLSDPAHPFADVTYSNFDSTNRITNWGLSGHVDYDMGPMTLTSITSLRETHGITNQDSDFSSADLLGRNFQNVKFNTFTQELRLNSDWDGPLDMLLGAFYLHEKVKQSNQLQFGTDFRSYAGNLIQSLSTQLGSPFTLLQVEGILGQAATGNQLAYIGRSFVPGTGFDESYRLSDNAYTIFAQGDYRITDRLTLTGGISYTHDSKKFSTDSISSDFFSSIPLSDPVLRANVVNVLAFQGVSQLIGSADPVTVGNWIAANQTTFNTLILPGAQSTAAKLGALKALQFMPPFLNVPNALESGRVKDGNFSYTARLAYDATDNINLYASFATGYKAASVNLSRDSRPTQADLTEINTNPAYAELRRANLSFGSRFAGPEKSTVFEAGLKGSWTNGLVNIAVFKQIIRGFQSNLFTGTGFYLANAGKQSSFGIEFEGSYKPFPGLTLSLAMTYLDPKYDRFIASGVGDLSGTRPGGVTRFASVAGIDWTHEFANGNRFIVHADWRHEAPFKLVEGLPGLVAKNPITGELLTGTSADYAAAIAAAETRKQTINQIDASITYAMDNGLEMTVWSRNLLDKRTILQIFDSPAQTGSISGYPSEPRTYGVSARYRF